jgi:hypothetical protein
LSLTQPTTPDRNHIVNRDVKRRAKHWNVGREDIRSAVERVGNSAGAARKELKQRGLIA